MDVVLSDRMRRLLCRGAFVLLCLLPTAWTVRHIVMPGTVASRTAALSLTLGVPVLAESFHTPTPGTTIIDNIVLGTESGNGQLFIDRLVLENRAEARLIRLGTISATPGALFSLLDQIERCGKVSLTADRPIAIQIERLQFTHPQRTDRELVFKNVALQYERVSGKAVLQLFPQTAHDNGVAIEVARIVDENQTSWMVRSNGHLLPAWLIEDLVPGVRVAGDEALIAGSIEMYQRESGWSGSLTDVTIDRLDLASAVYRTFGQPLTGFATVVIDSAALVDNRLCELRGRLASGNGEMGYGLLNALIESTAMVSAAGEVAGAPVPFAQMCFGFELKGCRITFASLNDPEGAVMFSERGDKLLFVRNGQPLPMMTIFRILSWPSDPDSPITRRTQGLANLVAWPTLTIPDFGTRMASEGEIVDPVPGMNLFHR